MNRQSLVALNSEALRTVDAASNNIPTAYSAAAGSAIRTTGKKTSQNFALINYTSAVLAISHDGGTTDHFVCPAANASGPGILFIEDCKMSTASSIRSLGSTVTAEKVYLMVW